MCTANFRMKWIELTTVGKRKCASIFCTYAEKNAAQRKSSPCSCSYVARRYCIKLVKNWVFRLQVTTCCRTGLFCTKHAFLAPVKHTTFLPAPPCYARNISSAANPQKEATLHFPHVKLFKQIGNKENMFHMLKLIIYIF